MSERGLTKINILYCGDRNVKNGIFYSSLSLAKNTDKALNIYILTAGIKTSEKEFFSLDTDFSKGLEKRLCRKNPSSRVFLFDISVFLESYLPTANLNTRFTPLCMLRLFADRVAEIPDRILYLDCDVLCRGGFEDFYYADISDCEIVGVLDRYGKWFFSRPLWRHNYLNSGVLLFNMKKIRESGLFEKCRALCRDKKMFMPDQTALNVTARKKLVPSRYNNQGKIKSDTVFKHFTTFFSFFPYFHSVTVKPWETDRVHSTLKLYEFDDIIKERIQ